MILTVPKDLPCLPQGPSADSLHAGLARKQGTASLGDVVAQCQQHSHTGSHKLLTGNSRPSTAAPGQGDGCLFHRATHSQFAGIHTSPQQVPSLRILGIVSEKLGYISTFIQGNSEDLQGKGGCLGLSEQRVISTEGAVSETPSQTFVHPATFPTTASSHLTSGKSQPVTSLSLSFPLTS